MDKPLRAPRNRTAEMQLILRLVTEGYTYWTADQLPLGKLSGFLKKWADYRLLADAPARAYRKRKGRANNFLILEHRFNTQDAVQEANAPLHWLMLSTEGCDGLGDSAAKQFPGKVSKVDDKHSPLSWMGYRIVRQRKQFTEEGGRVRSEITWTWRLQAWHYNEWEARLIQDARQRNYAALNASFEILTALPLFAGIRSQVIKLHQETNQMLKKVGATPLPPLNLPFMTLIPIWAEKAEKPKVRKAGLAKPDVPTGPDNRDIQVAEHRLSKMLRLSNITNRTLTESELSAKNSGKLKIRRQESKGLPDIQADHETSASEVPSYQKFARGIIGWIGRILGIPRHRP